MLNKLGKYELRRELGRGAMGIVYEGFDPMIKRVVAIKTIQTSLFDRSESHEALGRFRREAQAAGQLAHPNIIAIYEYGEENDMAFIAMEFITGKELHENFDKAGPVQISDALRIMAQLLDALEYSHKHGVVHRDIKPANILITRDGQVKIADFGIAKIESAATNLTQVGTIMGTPIYMSPEQITGLEVDRRSDIYSAGVLLYQLLTGERPFSGTSMTTIMHKVMNQMPALPSSVNSKIPPALDSIVMKAMAKRPEERFQSAAEFMHALDSVMLSPAAPAEPAADFAATIKLPPLDLENAPTIKLREPTVKTRSAPVLEFDFNASKADIEQRLEEEKRNTKATQREPATVRISALTTPSPMPAAAPAPAQAPTNKDDMGSTSSFLKSLAQEAEQKLGENQIQEKLDQAGAQRLSNALKRIHEFLNHFSKHVNTVSPAINRVYRLDARTSYTALKWQKAMSDVRKQNLSDTAWTANVMFGVHLLTAEPVVVMRPWDQLEALKRELQNLKLRVVDDTELNSKQAKHEWLKVQLMPTLPVLIDFIGNYDEGSIAVRTLNLEAFGPASFKLAAEDVTQEFLDELGIFLLARSDKLPAALKRI